MDRLSTRCTRFSLVAPCMRGVLLTLVVTGACATSAAPKSPDAGNSGKTPATDGGSTAKGDAAPKARSPLGVSELAYGRLERFTGDEEFTKYMARVRKALETHRRQVPRRKGETMDGVSATAGPAAAPAVARESKSAAEPGAGSITNTQEAGVDEGGIVKVAGDYFIVLRRGRLFRYGTRFQAARLWNRFRGAMHTRRGALRGPGTTRCWSMGIVSS